MGQDSTLQPKPDTAGDSIAACLALLDELPQLPTAIIRLFEVLASDASDRDQLAGILNQCTSLAAKVVGLANSAYFNRGKPVRSVADAIYVIGLRTVRSLATATALQEPFAHNRCPNFHPGRFWLQAVLTAHAAKALARKASPDLALKPEEAHLCGLLHGIGLLALVHLFPEDMNEMLAPENHCPGLLSRRIQQRFGMTHHVIGAALLSRWHLPELFSCTTRHYADPNYKEAHWMASRLVSLAHDWAERVIQQDDSPVFDRGALHSLGISPDEADRLADCHNEIDQFSELAELIAGEKPDFCAPAIANAAADLKDRLVDTIESLSCLSALSEIDIRGRSEASVLHGALRVLMANQNMQRCSIFMLHGDELHNSAGLSWSEQHAVHLERSQPPPTTQRFKVGEGLIGLAAETGQLQHCRDCSSDPRFKPTRPDRDTRLGSIISVPIYFQKNTLGVLNISHQQPNIFNDWDERFLYVFCNLLGQLITSNRLLHSMDHEIQQRTHQLQLALEQAESLSVMDALTGVHNRRYFMSHFNTLIEQSARHQNKLALLMIDADDFKQINDNHGHLEGDRILISIASILRQSARSADIIARFGGEEFIIALQDTDCEGAKQLAERILQQIRILSCGHGQTARGITASIGVSCYTHAADMPVKTAAQWIQEADDALYRAKHSGKNRIEVYVSDTPKHSQ